MVNVSSLETVRYQLGSRAPVNAIFNHRLGAFQHHRRLFLQPRSAVQTKPAGTDGLVPELGHMAVLAKA